MKLIKDLKVSEMDLFQSLKKEYIMIFNNYYIIPREYLEKEDYIVYTYIVYNNDFVILFLQYIKNL
ncbi:MAG: hypothetical protein CVV28_10415 [Methanobacteriales archaeon HGW-Methanobacteriales-1]|jgi:hypothetical protein|nr:MAG: hypothetical protein CVV28_10415 [Methanobacteriales archaeon HGW-Methanobacteriales-1]